MPEISILGCGWLGFPLAQSLKKKYPVKGSTTSENKLSELKNNGIEPFLISFSADGFQGDVDAFLFGSQILIIAIPPKTADGNFADKMRILISEIEKSSVEKVLFVSSISVYGETDGIVTEEIFPAPETENGKQILEAENLLKAANCKTTVLRFGGLVGEERHPVKYLAGKENLPKPEAPVNLIHLQDCIGIIESVIANEAWDETLNAVAPFHPSRKNFYTQKAIDYGLPLPFFDESSSGGKIVDSQKLIALLNYAFSDLLQ